MTIKNFKITYYENEDRAILQFVDSGDLRNRRSMEAITIPWCEETISREDILPIS